MLLGTDSTLLAWLTMQGHVVQFSEIPEDPANTAKHLMALSDPSCAPGHLSINSTIVNVVQKPASFSVLTTCCLKSECESESSNVDLVSFERLQKLTSLYLETGPFVNISAASHLTH